MVAVTTFRTTILLTVFLLELFTLAPEIDAWRRRRRRRPPPPVNGRWSGYSYGGWSTTCGTGRRYGSRSCNNPRPAWGGQGCSSSCCRWFYRYGFNAVNGRWGRWGAWSATCGSVSRRRSCNSPSPSCGGSSCPGSSVSTRSTCCPRHGGWSTWTSWSTWAMPSGRTCDYPASRARSRLCTNPTPYCRGRACPGLAHDSQSRPASASCCSNQWYVPGTSACRECAPACAAGYTQTRGCGGPSTSDRVCQDLTAPVITVNGQGTSRAAPFRVQAATTYVDPGRTCVDRIEGDITSSISQNTPNMMSVGAQTITYRCADSAGNDAAPQPRFVVVYDSVDPVITIRGDTDVDHEAATPYTDLGATCNDVVYGSLTVTTTGDGFDTTGADRSHTITYSCADGSGNTATATRTVHTVDNTIPIITLRGTSPLVYEASLTASPYVDAGATCADTVDGPLTAVTTVDPMPVSMSTLGTYVYTYSCRDLRTPPNVARNVTRTVVVHDTIDPVLELLGNLSMTHEGGAPWVDPGYTASDNLELDLTSSVMTNVTLNVSQPAGFVTYIGYTVCDSSGNCDSATRVVTIIDTTIPVISLGACDLGWGGPDNMTCLSTHEVHTPYYDTYNGTDDLDGDISGSVVVVETPTFDADAALGTVFQFTYTLTDAFGNVAVTQHRNVTIIDSTPPWIVLYGNDTVLLEAGDNYTDAGAEAEENAIPYNLTDVMITSGVEEVRAAGLLPVPAQSQYNVTYNVTDLVGLSVEMQRLVIIVDTVPPNITLFGDINMTLEAGDVYQEPGYFSYDTVYRANLTNRVTTEITVMRYPRHSALFRCNGVAEPPANSSDMVVGSTVDYVDSGVGSGTEYRITYIADDLEENLAYAYRYVTIIDSEGPTITLNGEAVESFELGTGAYVEQWATASDDASGNMTGCVFATVYVNSSAAPFSQDVLVRGTLSPVMVTAAPTMEVSAGNVSNGTNTTANTTAFTTMTTTTLTPMSTIVREHVVTTCHNAACVEAYVMNMSSMVPADVGIVITYTVVDDSGLSASTSREVFVQDSMPPVMVVQAPPSIVVNKTGEPFLAPNCTCTDAHGAVLACTNNIPAAPLDAGAYEFMFVCTDGAGHSVNKTLSVFVSVEDATTHTSQGTEVFWVQMGYTEPAPPVTTAPTAAPTFAAFPPGAITTMWLSGGDVSEASVATLFLNTGVHSVNQTCVDAGCNQIMVKTDTELTDSRIFLLSQSRILEDFKVSKPSVVQTVVLYADDERFDEDEAQAFMAEKGMPATSVNCMGAAKVCIVTVPTAFMITNADVSALVGSTRRVRKDLIQASIVQAIGPVVIPLPGVTNATRVTSAVSATAPTNATQVYCNSMFSPECVVAVDNGHYQLSHLSGNTFGMSSSTSGFTYDTSGLGNFSARGPSGVQLGALAILIQNDIPVALDDVSCPTVYMNLATCSFTTSLLIDNARMANLAAFAGVTEVQPVMVNSVVPGASVTGTLWGSVVSGPRGANAGAVDVACLSAACAGVLQICEDDVVCQVNIDRIFATGSTQGSDVDGSAPLTRNVLTCSDANCGSAFVSARSGLSDMSTALDNALRSSGVLARSITCESNVCMYMSTQDYVMATPLMSTSAQTLLATGLSSMMFGPQQLPQASMGAFTLTQPLSGSATDIARSALIGAHIIPTTLSCDTLSRTCVYTTMQSTVGVAAALQANAQVDVVTQVLVDARNPDQTFEGEFSVDTTVFSDEQGTMQLIQAGIVPMSISCHAGTCLFQTQQPLSASQLQTMFDPLMQTSMAIDREYRPIEPSDGGDVVAQTLLETIMRDTGATAAQITIGNITGVDGSAPMFEVIVSGDASNETMYTVTAMVCNDTFNIIDVLTSLDISFSGIHISEDLVLSFTTTTLLSVNDTAAMSEVGCITDVRQVQRPELSVGQVATHLQQQCNAGLSLNRQPVPGVQFTIMEMNGGGCPLTTTTTTITTTTTTTTTTLPKFVASGSAGDNNTSSFKSWMIIVIAVAGVLLVVLVIVVAKRKGGGKGDDENERTTVAFQNPLYEKGTDDVDFNAGDVPSDLYDDVAFTNHEEDTTKFNPVMDDGDASGMQSNQGYADVPAGDGDGDEDDGYTDVDNVEQTEDGGYLDVEGGTEEIEYDDTAPGNEVMYDVAADVTEAPVADFGEEDETFGDNGFDDDYDSEDE
eukprot:m.1484958 g.1484958  ORF g.1484958 m.1484958 type:complete len:2171 (+) comp25179_c0_seq2:190-6702(+)